MFEDMKEFRQFMIFCHTHYELNDVWHFDNGDKGILFEGWHNNDTGNQKYTPAKLNEQDQPTYKKRTQLDEVYETWQKVRANLLVGYNIEIETMAKKRVVQVKNPRTGKYVKIDRSKGRIISSKKSAGPYKGVALARKNKKKLLTLNK